MMQDSQPVLQTPMLAIPDSDLYGLLRDDVPSGDLTTDALAICGHTGRIEFRARQPMTVCCTEEAVRMFELAGAQAELVSGSGLAVPAGTLLLHASGSAAALHTAWKASQILVEWASGIAAATAAIVASADGTPVACTARTRPAPRRFPPRPCAPAAQRCIDSASPKHC